MSWRSVTLNHLSTCICKLYKYFTVCVYNYNNYYCYYFIITRVLYCPEYCFMFLWPLHIEQALILRNVFSLYFHCYSFLHQNHWNHCYHWKYVTRWKIVMTFWSVYYNISIDRSSRKKKPSSESSGACLCKYKIDVFLCTVFCRKCMHIHI